MPRTSRRARTGGLLLLGLLSLWLVVRALRDPAAPVRLLVAAGARRPAQVSL